MTTLNFNGTTAYVKCNPITTAINNLPNGVGTMAVLYRRPNLTTDDDICGLRGGDVSGGYYAGYRGTTSASEYFDDNGLVGLLVQSAGGTTGTTADDFMIGVIDWPSTDAVIRHHGSGKIGSAESWTHNNSVSTSGGTHSGPGTGSGYFLIGNYDGAWFAGDIALVGVWSGIRFGDTDAQDLWINKKTSDWWNHPAGKPDTLIELTSTTLTDIGNNPLSSLVVTAATATGLDPTGWTFDGRGTIPGLPVAAWKPNFVYLRKNR